MPKHGSPGYQHIEQDDYSDGVLEEVWAWVEKHGVDPHDVIRISETEEEPLTIPEMLDAVLDIETRQLRAMARDELIKAADQIAALEAEAATVRAETLTFENLNESTS